MRFIITPMPLIVRIFYSLFTGATCKKALPDIVFKKNNHAVVFPNSKSAYNALTKSKFLHKRNDYVDASNRLRKKDISALSKSENLNSYKSYLKKLWLNWGGNNIEKVTILIKDTEVKINTSKLYVRIQL